MTSVSYEWMFYIPTLLMIIFCIVSIIVVLAKPSELNRPKAYAVTALGVLLICQFTHPIINVVANKWIGTQDFTLIAVTVSIFITSAMMFAIGLLLMAVFIDRKPPSPSSTFDTGGTPLADRPSDNPYASPKL